MTRDEACSIIHGSKDLLAQLTNAGVIRVATAESQTGSRLYSRLDLEAVANQLYGDGASAEVAVGLKPAPPVEKK